MTAALPGTSSPLAAARAHWTIYLPTFVVAAVWAAVHLWAALHEPPLASLRALSLAVELLAVPTLLFFAVLRARILTVEVKVRSDGEGRATGARELYLREGFGSPRELRIGADEIAFVRVRRSLVQRLLGGGALDVRTMSGERVWIGDLDAPDAVAHAVGTWHAAAATRPQAP